VAFGDFGYSVLEFIGESAHAVYVSGRVPKVIVREQCPPDDHHDLRLSIIAEDVCDLPEIGLD
jgi:hypothetical protein